METRRRRLSASEAAEGSNNKSSTAAETNEETSNNDKEKKPRGRRSGGADSFQKEIQKWEEFHDDMKTYLTDGALTPRSQANVLKQADSFFLSPDGVLHYKKTVRDGAEVLSLPVVRSYEERMQVCRSIHLSTGEECIHHRRDTMLDILGQQYYWKGQRRDVCQCIASCEMCSIGLGGKRRAKPPGQRRDIRLLPNKLPRLDPTLVPPIMHPGTPSYLPPPSSSSPPPPPPSTTSSPATTASTSSSSEHGLTAATSAETGNTSNEESPLVTVSSMSSDAVAHTPTDTAGTASTTDPPHTESHKQQALTQEAQARQGLLCESSSSARILFEAGNCTAFKKQLRPTASFPHLNSAFTPVDPLANLYTIAEACLLNNSGSDSAAFPSLPPSSRATNPELSIASEVTVSDNSGLQIFTTINEPYYDGHGGGRSTAANGRTLSCRGQPPLVVSDLCVGSSSVVTPATTIASGGVGAGGDDEQYVVQTSSSCGAEDMTVDTSLASSVVEPSIYQLLFQLPSRPNTTLCTAVIESMQMSLKSVAHPAQLSKVAGQSLVSVFGLPSSTTQAVVCPSHGAAYLTSLTALLSKQGQLTATTSLAQQASSNPPPIVLHDTICDTGSPKALSSLLGACNWSLGTSTGPMNREMLHSAITSNRVNALLYRPFAYPKNTSFLRLDALSSICRPQNISIITDCHGLAANSLFQLTSTIKEMLTTGADLIMLPTTDQFQGPPHTCVLIGHWDLLSCHWQTLSRLQTDIPLPLFCSPYDTVGSVVAFKSLQVSSFKTEPSNFDY